MIIVRIRDDHSYFFFGWSTDTDLRNTRTVFIAYKTIAPKFLNEIFSVDLLESLQEFSLIASVQAYF